MIRMISKTTQWYKTTYIGEGHQFPTEVYVRARSPQEAVTRLSVDEYYPIKEDWIIKVEKSKEEHVPKGYK
jgi:hypothetical protein